MILAKGGESAWLHQEIGVAKGRSIPVLVLKEEGTSFSEGLLSDLEYASFPVDVISATFIPLLQPLRYVFGSQVTANYRLNADAPHRLAARFT